jgi:hypothetical protein
MSYQIVLAIHLLALVAAAFTSGMVHLAEARRSAAPTLRQALEWGGIMARAARVFPITVVTFIATGSYMAATRWGWGLGWIEAGLAGAILLLVSGAVLGKRGAAAAKAMVERLQHAGRDLPNPRTGDRVSAALSNANTGLAIAIVLVMTLKPGLAVSFAILAVGAAIGARLGLSHTRATATAAELGSAEAA